MKIRLPLQVGTTAFWALTRSAALLLPSFALLLLALPIVILTVIAGLGQALKALDLKSAGTIVLMGVGTLAILGLSVWSAVRQLLHAFRERPSDVVLDEDSLTIVGGPHGGETYQTASLGCHYEDEHKERFVPWRVLGQPFEKYTIGHVTINGKLVATAVRPVEKASLQALTSTLQSRHAKHAAPPVAQGIAILKCPNCDAPAVPKDAPAVTCASCSASIPMPAELAAKLHAQRTLAQDRPENQRRIAALIQQPSATFAWSVMLALGIPILLAWPIAGVTAGVLWHKHQLTTVHATVLFAGALVAIFALFFVMRAALINRQALSLLASTFAAHAPAAPGAPHTCRTCAAPLPDTEGQVLVHCAYCDSENILGLDLRHTARREARQARSLTDELARRSRDRAVLGSLAAVSFLLLMSARWTVPFLLQPHTDRARCERAFDAAACGRAGTRLEAKHPEDARALYTIGCEHHDQPSCLAGAKLVYADSNPDRSLPMLRAACDAGDLKACSQAGLREQDGLDDEAAAMTFFAKACDGHYIIGCNNLGFLYYKGKHTPHDLAKARALFQTACDGHFADACTKLAKLPPAAPE